MTKKEDIIEIGVIERTSYTSPGFNNITTYVHERDIMRNRIYLRNSIICRLIKFLVKLEVNRLLKKASTSYNFKRFKDILDYGR